MKILHLTDLHFEGEKQTKEEKNKWRLVLNEIENACREMKIDRIVITGDLTCQGKEEEFRQARDFVLELIKRIKLKRKQVLFCPGNHDADSERAHSEFFHYESFIKEFYGKDDLDFRMEHKKVSRKTGERLQFAFLSENTCTETSLVFFDQAVIPEHFMLELDKVKKEEYGILLMHHQPEVIKNQQAFRQIVDDGRIRLILCGHLHTTETRLYQAGKTQIVNGMAITPHCDWLPSGFQVIQIKAGGKLKVVPFYIKLTN